MATRIHFLMADELAQFLATVIAGVEAMSAYLENLTPDPSLHDGLVVTMTCGRYAEELAPL